MSYIKHTPEYDDMVNEHISMRTAANRLRSRAMRHPHPMDPDALDEDEMDRLQELENWEP